MFNFVCAVVASDFVGPLRTVWSPVANTPRSQGLNVVAAGALQFVGHVEAVLYHVAPRRLVYALKNFPAPELISLTHLQNHKNKSVSACTHSISTF